MFVFVMEVDRTKDVWRSELTGTGAQFVTIDGVIKTPMLRAEV